MARSASGATATPRVLAGTGAQLPAATVGVAAGRSAGLLGLLGATVVNGVATHVDPVYMSRPQFSVARSFRKWIFFVALVPLILPLFVALLVLSAGCSIFGMGRRAGFLSNLASQVVGFALTSRLLGPKADIPVRDVRVRDTAGNEHLVRMRGDFTAGNVNVGDDVTLEGFRRRGTVVFWRGRNHRIGADIRVKVP